VLRAGVVTKASITASILERSELPVGVQLLNTIPSGLTLSYFQAFKGRPPQAATNLCAQAFFKKMG